MEEQMEDILERVRKEGRTYLMEHESKAVLESWGSGPPGQRWPDRSKRQWTYSDPSGGPSSSRSSLQRSSTSPMLGGVKLNLRTEDEVRKAYQEMAASFRDTTIAGISVQEMASPGIEVIIGVAKDSTFGPVLMFGLGGIFVEVLKEVSFRSIPISETDAQDMIEEIKGYALLQGYRGHSADIPALRDCCCRYRRWSRKIPRSRRWTSTPSFFIPRAILWPTPGSYWESRLQPQKAAALSRTCTTSSIPKHCCHRGLRNPGKAGLERLYQSGQPQVPGKALPHQSQGR